MSKPVSAIVVACALAVCLPISSDAQYGRARRTGAAPGAPLNTSPYKDMAGDFHGKMKVLNKKEITIQTDDNEIVTMRRSGKTKFYQADKEIKATDIDLDTPIIIEAKEDNDLKLLALKVTVDVQPKKAAAPKQ